METNGKVLSQENSEGEKKYVKNRWKNTEKKEIRKREKKTIVSWS